MDLVLFLHLSMGQMGHSFSQLFPNGWQFIPKKPLRSLKSLVAKSLFVWSFGMVPSTMKPNSDRGPEAEL